MTEARLSDGRTLSARTWPRRGRNLVVLHGNGDSAEGWDAICRDSTRPCVALDLPGFGGSDPAARATIDAYADDVATALGQLAPARFTLLGQSFGGAVAAAVAERLLDAVASLVLLAPGGFGPNALADIAVLPGVREQLAAAARSPIGRLVLVGLHMTLLSPGRMPPASLLRRLQRDHARHAPAVRAATAALRAAERRDDAMFRRRVAFDGPVFVLWGGRDQVVPLTHAPAVRRALPQPQISVWPDLAQHEHPRRLARFIERSCRYPARPPGKLVVRGRLVHEGAVQR